DLLPLRATLGPPDVLVRLALGKIAVRERLFGSRPRLGGPLGGERQHRLSGAGRVEVRVRVHCARNAEQLVAPARRLGIEEPLDPIEPPGGDPCERGGLLRREAGRAAADLLPDGALREPPDRHELAARPDRLRQRAELVRDEHDDGVGRRLLEILEQGIRGLGVQQVGAEDEVDAPRGLERAHVQVVAQIADLVDPDLVAERFEHVEVGVRAPLDAVRLAEELARERQRGDALADPGRAVEEVGVGRFRGLRERRVEETLRLVLLDQALERHTPSLRRTSPATCSAGPVPSTSSTRSGKRSASCAYAPATASWNPSPSRSIRSGSRSRRAAAVAASTSTTNVLSGSSPSSTITFSWSTASSPSPRAIPW